MAVRGVASGSTAAKSAMLITNQTAVSAQTHVHGSDKPFLATVIECSDAHRDRDINVSEDANRRELCVTTTKNGGFSTGACARGVADIHSGARASVRGNPASQEGKRLLG
eukprot:1187770-Prorocentrum_minimum.AAC.2